jgi:hypothetical protein
MLLARSNRVILDQGSLTTAGPHDNPQLIKNRCDQRRWLPANTRPGKYKALYSDKLALTDICQREDWNLGGCSLGCFDRGVATRHDHVDVGTNEFLCVCGEFRTAQSKPPLVDCQIFPFYKARAPKFGAKGQMMRCITRSRKQAANPIHPARLLPPSAYSTTLARVVLAQLMPDDRKIEWAPTLKAVENLLVGATAPSANISESAGAERLARAGAVFSEMQKAYAAGDFARYGELLQELGRILSSH